MNKNLVEELLPHAVKAIKDTGICDEKQRIDKTFRGQISSFGAAVSTGSLLAAVAFFSAKGGASVDRQHLMEAINNMLRDSKRATVGATLFDTVKNAADKQKIKEDVLCCAVAIKLAMNLFDLGQGEEKEDKKEAAQ